MNNEKVKEIKKALEFCCGACDCDCPFYKNGKSYEECKSLLLSKALTLINELESDNEKLEKQCVEWSELNFKKKKQVVELRDRIAELEEGIAQSMLGCEFLPECTNDKLKQFAEKIAKRLINIKGIKEILDETLKEIINEK